MSDPTPVEEVQSMNKHLEQFSGETDEWTSGPPRSNALQQRGCVWESSWEMSLSLQRMRTFLEKNKD
jgi:hypothetical protein